VNPLTDTPIVIKNFVGSESLGKLNSWCMENQDKDFFKDATMGIPGTRKTTRYEKNDFVFPEKAYQIQNKIINHFELDFILPKFKDGIICGIGFDGSDIHPHKDPVHHQNTYTLHCNIVSQKPKFGGSTYINNKEYNLDAGDMLCFIPSRDYHYVNTIRGNTPRIVWIFGFSILIHGL
jgi:hypothetical protein